MSHCVNGRPSLKIESLILIERVNLLLQLLLYKKISLSLNACKMNS